MTDKPKIKEMSLIELINVILKNTLEIESVFELILEYACQLINVSKGSIMMVNDTYNTLVIRTVYNKDKKLIGQKVSIDQSIAGWVYRNQKPALINNIEEDAYFHKKNSPEFEKKHLLSYPLILNGSILGIINFNDKIKGDTFSWLDLDLIDRLCKQILFSMEQALCEEKTAKVLSDMFNEIVTLYETSEHFLKSYDLIDLFGYAFKVIKSSLNVSEVSLWLFDKNNNLELKAREGLTDIPKYAPETSIIYYVSQKCKPVIINDISFQSIFDADKILSFEKENFLAVPIGNKENTVGVLTAGKKYKARIYYQSTENLISDGDKRLLLTISSQLFIAYNYIKMKNNLEDMVTARTKALNEALSKLKQINESKNEFYSFMSHELRSPLNIIHSSVQLIKSKYETDPYTPEEYNEFFNIIEEATNRMTKQVDNMLDLAKLEDGQMEFHFDYNDINNIIEMLVYQFKPKLSEKNIIINTELDKTITKFYFDHERIQIVISNLLDNAFKYNKEDGKIFIKSYVKNDYAVIEIEDTGIGISPAHQKKLFNKYNRFSSSNEKGTGLGLAISKKIMQEHNGVISVDSVLYKGSKFILKLPYKPTKID